MNDYSYTIPKDILCPTLLELSEKDDRIVVLSSDVSVSVNIEGFKEKYPERFFEMGIAEQSTMSVSGGLASEGMIPVYAALAIFSCGMTWPQMRQVCNNKLNVKIIGTHAGADDGQDGSGHHATEDMAIARVLPGMTVLTPSDENETAAAVKAMIAYEGPVYMRIARANTPVIHDKNCTFTIGKAETVFDEGDDFAILYEGSALTQALDGFQKLSERGRCGKLVGVRSIKPFDTETVRRLAGQVKALVTVENHSVVGGLFSCVAETLAPAPGTARLGCIGFQDRFLESGSAGDIKNKYGLSGEKICEKVESLLA